MEQVDRAPQNESVSPPYSAQLKLREPIPKPRQMHNPRNHRSNHQEPEPSFTTVKPKKRQSHNHRDNYLGTETQRYSKNRRIYTDQTHNREHAPRFIRQELSPESSVCTIGS